VPLDLPRAWERPVGEGIGGTRGASCGRRVECCLPRVAGRCAKDVAAVGGGDAPADGVPLVAADTAFSLFEVDGVGRAVSVDDGVAPPLEVGPSCPIDVVSRTKGRNGAVEGCPQLGEPGIIVALAECSVAKRLRGGMPRPWGDLG
jgi:hypothetical protein